MAFRDPAVLTVVSGHPFVAKRESAGTRRIGRVIALDRPGNCPPQGAVFRASKMRLQKFCDRQIRFYGRQGFIKPSRMGNRSFVGR